MDGVPANEHPTEDTLLQKISNNPVVQFFFRPLGNFDQILRMFGRKAVNGEGYLWNRFMRGYIDNAGREYKAIESAYATLDAKVSEIFGRAMRWSDLYDVEKDMPKAVINFVDGGAMTEHELSQGNLLYIMLADQMLDGRMKLRRMGITEENIREIRNQMDPRFLELADWVVHDFLPSRRGAYNEVYQRMFGATMGKVENYFPLKVLKNARVQQLDVSSANVEATTPSTVTGNIMQRTKNSLALDVIGADAFSMVIEHVQKMEHWAAFAEWNRDLSDLLSYRDFRNRVQNLTSIYGSKESLWREFLDASMVAAGSYQGRAGKTDLAFNKIAKGVTAAKISLRVFTAIKQFLSFPAYFSEANPKYLAEGLAKGWNWCMDNLPMFEKRWKSRQAGDHILAEGNLGRLNEKLAQIGMTPNAAVDAFTVSIGAYAIFRTRKDRYLQMGFSEEAAEKRAKQDAVISYNETQQSSESAFLSSMQAGRSTWEKAFTVFRNSSMGYQRQVHDALRNYKRRFLDKDYKRESVQFMTNQFIAEGLDPSQALKAAKAMYGRQGFKDAVRLVIFGYGLQLLWSLAPHLPYLIFGDDDDKKNQMWADAAEKAIFGSLEGLTGGNLISEAGNLLVFGEGLSNWNPELLPLLSDFKNIVREIGKDNVRALNDIFNLAVQAMVGVNPETLENAIIAVMDTFHWDMEASKELWMLALRLANAPQSSLDKYYIDELQMDGLEASRLSVQELAERYAEYKMRRGAGLFTPLYGLDPELREKVEKKYLDKITGAAREEFDDYYGSERFVQLDDEWKALSKEVRDLQDRAKAGDEEADRRLLEIFSDPDARYYSLERFHKGKADYDAEVKAAISSETHEEMMAHLNRAGEIRDELVRTIDGVMDADTYWNDRFEQYRTKILPKMAELEKRYAKEYAEGNSDYQDWKKRHQEELDKASQGQSEAKERIAAIDAELETLKKTLPNGKTKYLNPARRKKLNEEKRQLKSVLESPSKAVNDLLKEEELQVKDYVPDEVYNSPEFQLYLRAKEMGFSGSNFKELTELKRQIEDSEDALVKERLRRKIERRQRQLGQELTRILNGVEEEDKAEE